MPKDFYIFPAIFEYADGISVEFPDLPSCLPCAQTTEDAVNDAREAAALHLYSMEKDGETLPKPTPIDRLKLATNQIPILIEIFMPRYREAIDNSYVRKSFTLPGWLERIAA